jgi:hypothetical protein
MNSATNMACISERPWCGRVTVVRTLLAAIVATASFGALADDELSVTPYRPSISTPANLSAPGYLELELGVLAVRSANSERRNSLPYGLKLAFNPDWGIRVTGEGVVGQTDASGHSVNGFGDTSIVLKHRFAVDDLSAFGLELGATAPTGREGISAGSGAYSVTGIYSADIGHWHTDVNLLATRMGKVDAGVSATQTLWAASLSRAANDRLGLTGELSGTSQRGLEKTSQFLFAASYSLSKVLVLDAGFTRSLHSGASDSSFFLGLTVLGPRLF